jgi:nucleoside-diphosphate-sugar epimerase
VAKKTALVVGASGIVGLNLASLLAATGDWDVYGLSRKAVPRENVRPVAADLQNAESVNTRLSCDMAASADRG